MKLDLPARDPRFKSASQAIRDVSERWGEANLYCASCTAPTLARQRASAAVVDFQCAACQTWSQLKFGGARKRIIENGAYAQKQAWIRSRAMPDYILGRYDRDTWRVSDLWVVPGHFITANSIRARNELPPTHPRAGHVLSTIRLDALPPDAMVPVVADGEVRDPHAVRVDYRRFNFLRERGERAAGWMTEVLKEVRAFGTVGESFELVDFYLFAEARLASRFPNNRNVRPKMRQQLQELLIRGVVARERPGRYRVVA